jgi:hypothetical protein
VDSEDESGRLVDYSSDDDADIEQGKPHGHINGSGTVPPGDRSISTSGTLTPGDISPAIIRGAALGTDASPSGDLGPRLIGHHEDDDTVTFRRHYNDQDELSVDESTFLQRLKAMLRACRRKVVSSIRAAYQRSFSSLPSPMQKFLSTAGKYTLQAWCKFMEVMNPPLWAMLSAIIVASVPLLKHVFYTKGTFISK